MWDLLVVLLTIILAYLGGLGLPFVIPHTHPHQWMLLGLVPTRRRTIALFDPTFGSFTLLEMVSLVKVFRLFKLEQMFCNVQSVDTVGRYTTCVCDGLLFTLWRWVIFLVTTFCSLAKKKIEEEKKKGITRVFQMWEIRKKLSKTCQSYCIVLMFPTFIYFVYRQIWLNLIINVHIKFPKCSPRCSK